jgi:acyl-CoA thioesterase-1
MLRLVVLIVLLAPCSVIQGAPTERRILIVGDSLTAGYGVAKEQAFPALLEKNIQKTWPDIRVINAGSSGSTTASAVGRLRWHLKKKPFLLILALGANDGLRGTPLAATKKNLSDAIDLAKENGIKVYLAGMKLPMNYGSEYRDQFEKLFRDLVKTKNINEIPFLLKGVGVQPELNLADGIHPNEEGHKKIAATVYETIKGDL